MAQKFVHVCDRIPHLQAETVGLPPGARRHDRILPQDLPARRQVQTVRSGFGE